MVSSTGWDVKSNVFVSLTLLAQLIDLPTAIPFPL